MLASFRGDIICSSIIGSKTKFVCMTTLSFRYRLIIANELPNRVAIYVIGRKVEFSHFGSKFQGPEFCHYVVNFTMIGMTSAL